MAGIENEAGAEYLLNRLYKALRVAAGADSDKDLLADSMKDYTMRRLGVVGDLIAEVARPDADDHDGYALLKVA